MTESTRRKQKESGWGPPRKNELGNPVCRRCAGPIGKGRRTFCGPECVNEWRIRTDPSYARAMVFERDQGVCALCGFDAKLHSSRPWRAGHLWQADHIIPVVEGGGECGIYNYRTLCTACHKSETAELARRRAEARNPTKQLTLPINSSQNPEATA